MAKTTRQVRDEAGTTADPLEQKLVAFAERLGALVGTVQGRADGWLDRTALTKELGRIRESAADLLKQVNPMAKSRSKSGSRKKVRATRASRGLVDAPGKRHRTSPPQDRGAKRMEKPKGEVMGQKAAKMGRRGGRG